MDLSALSYDEWEEAHQREQKRVKRMSELALGDIPKPPPLIHGLLLDKTLTMLSSEPYTGKTMLTLAIALALDSGRPLFGHHQVRERKRILYLGQDATSWDYAEQSRKLIAGYSLTPEEIDNLETDLILNTGMDLLEPKSLKSIQDWHTVSNFNVIILDTLASMHSGDENSTRDMSVICAILKSLRDSLKCAVIFTHHTAKPSQGVARSANYSARGSSVIAGSIDFHLHLRRDGSSERIHINMAKGRGSGGMNRSSFFDIVEDLTPGGVESVKLVSPSVSPFTDGHIISELGSGPRTRSRLIEVVQTKSPIAISRLTAASLTDNALAALSRAGKVAKAGRATWSLP